MNSESEGIRAAGSGARLGAEGTSEPSMGLPLGQGFDERVPVVLVLDTSDSMARPREAPRIAELNAALADWLQDTRSRPGLRSRVEIAIVTFGSEIQVLELAPDRSAAATRDGRAHAAASTAFAPIGDVADPVLTTSGFTLMLPAIEVAVDLAAQRRRLLREQGVPSRRPLIWLLTDGAASTADGEPLQAGDLAGAARLLRAAEQPHDQDDGCLFFAIGVGEADRTMLEVLAPASTMMLGSVRFRDILGLVSHSSDLGNSSDEPAAAYQQARELAEFAEGLRSLEQRYLDQ